ncbi:hypothetical protein N7462_008161 [Penicillium macrosclerotiorum]|uniref:uncharacterized protein n=1 Tax=Penicillium macrosclerotiorum TaxID=303699 RepID=UPI002546883C|nr:uncharacterized protein N7462_008161 [Penicillium macrosclerotiorum]KAJ5679917.1 hypothetical protein N7462_008161 [Penicillium macrosclerotiorum]
MPGVPSNKACERCKKRHLKCDETRPHCQRCATAGVECPGYVQTRKFIDQGATVRRRYAPYQEPHAKLGTTANAGKQEEHAPQPTQSEAPPIKIPQMPGLGSSDRAKEESMFQFQLETANSSSGNLPGASNTPCTTGVRAQNATSNAPRPGLSPEVNQFSALHNSGSSYRSPLCTSVSPNPITGFNPALETYSGVSSDRPESRRLVSSESVSQRSEKEEFQDIFSELMTGTEHEIAFLTRHYAEVLGPWLDLSDGGKFFTVYVPIRSNNSPSLKYSIAALAAKQLARVKGVKASTLGGMFTNPSTTETYPNAGQVDWFLKAANYYYLAASDLTRATSNGYTVVSSSAVLDSPVEMVSRWLDSQVTQTTTEGSDEGTILRKIEDIMATVTILTLCKLFDAQGEEWHQYLSGIRSVFDSLQQIKPRNTALFSRGIRACFWNFARQDYLGSYFTKSATYFDPGNLDMWRAAGILIDEFEKFHIGGTEMVSISPEDQAANGLSWLVSKAVNFLAKSKESQISQWTGSPPEKSPGSPDSPAGSNPPDTSTWLGLCFEFQTWFEGVPETFRPCVRLERPRNLSSPESSSHLPFPEVYHSLATCAAAMQHYHFGRIALLLNRPPDVTSAPSTAFDRLQGYREVTKEVEYRSREVCGIALGRPQGEVRVYMTPLLFAVGQCLEGTDEHQIIVDLLQGVEADLGWATEYAVRELQTLWSR